VPATYKITITEDVAHTGIEKVFLDYINGTFALGSTAGSVVTPGITMTLGATSSVVVRGSSGADKIYLGSTYSANVVPKATLSPPASAEHRRASTCLPQSLISAAATTMARSTQVSPWSAAM